MHGTKYIDYGSPKAIKMEKEKPSRSRPSKYRPKTYCKKIKTNHKYTVEMDYKVGGQYLWTDLVCVGCGRKSGKHYDKTGTSHWISHIKPVIRS